MTRRRDPGQLGVVPWHPGPTPRARAGRCRRPGGGGRWVTVTVTVLRVRPGRGPPADSDPAGRRPHLSRSGSELITTIVPLTTEIFCFFHSDAAFVLQGTRRAMDREKIPRLIEARDRGARPAALRLARKNVMILRLLFLHPSPDPLSPCIPV